MREADVRAAGTGGFWRAVRARSAQWVQGVGAFQTSEAHVVLIDFSRDTGSEENGHRELGTELGFLNG
jgi:hypothetical protein